MTHSTNIKIDSGYPVPDPADRMLMLMMIDWQTIEEDLASMCPTSEVSDGEHTVPAINAVRLTLEPVRTRLAELEAETRQLQDELRLARGQLTVAEQYRQDFLDGTLEARQD